MTKLRIHLKDGREPDTAEARRMHGQRSQVGGASILLVS